MALNEQKDLKEKKVTDKTLVAPVENSDPCCMPDFVIILVASSIGL